jgi:uncharacterized protein YkwD
MLAILEEVIQKILLGIFALITVFSFSFVYLLNKDISGKKRVSPQSKLAQKRLEKFEKSEKIKTTVEELEQITVVEAEVGAINDDYTIELLQDTEKFTIQLIGIQAPTNSQNARYKKCFDTTLIDQLKAQLLKQPLFLIADASWPDEANSKRLYRYAFTKDATFLNRNLLQKGFAQIDTNISLSTLYGKELQEDQKKAEAEKIGIWGKTCEKIPSPTSTQKNKIPTTTISQKPSPTPTKSQSVLNSSSSQIPIPSPTPTLKPTAKTPVLTPDLLQQSITTIPTPKNSLNADLLFVLINIHRKSKSLPSFEKDDQLCRLADARAPELYDEIFVTGKIHQGLYDRNLPYWITENMAHYDSEEEILKWWLGSTIHRNAIEGNAKYSCGTCSGNSCAQLFTNYTPK